MLPFFSYQKHIFHQKLFHQWTFFTKQLFSNKIKFHKKNFVRKKISQKNHTKKSPKTLFKKNFFHNFLNKKKGFQSKIVTKLRNPNSDCWPNFEQFFCKNNLIPRKNYEMYSGQRFAIQQCFLLEMSSKGENFQQVRNLASTV